MPWHGGKVTCPIKKICILNWWTKVLCVCSIRYLLFDVKIVGNYNNDVMFVQTILMVILLTYFIIYVSYRHVILLLHSSLNIFGHLNLTFLVNYMYLKLLLSVGFFCLFCSFMHGYCISFGEAIIGIYT